MATGTMGSDIIVLNTNSKSANSAPLNPYSAEASALVVGVPQGANFLELFHDYTGTDPVTALVVRAFGHVPTFGIPSTSALKHPDRSWPYDANSSFGTNLTDMWIPLIDPDGDTSGTGYYALTFASAILSATGLKRSPPKYVYLSGCDAVNIRVSVAATDATVGVVSGRFLF